MRSVESEMQTCSHLILKEDVVNLAGTSENVHEWIEFKMNLLKMFIQRNFRLGKTQMFLFVWTITEL